MKDKANKNIGIALNLWEIHLSGSLLGTIKLENINQVEWLLEFKKLFKLTDKERELIDDEKWEDRPVKKVPLTLKQLEFLYKRLTHPRVEVPVRAETLRYRDKLKEELDKLKSQKEETDE